MKTKDFNKMGGTEFRVGNQRDAFYAIIQWIYETQNDYAAEMLVNEKDKWNKKFIEYCKEQEIYNYSSESNTESTKRINRFDMLSSRLLKWGLIKEKNNKYLIDKEIIETKDTNVISKYFLENIYKNYLPFKKMIDFLISFDKEKINTQQLLLAFAVCNEKEDFDEIYHANNIIDKIAHINIENVKSNDLLNKKYLRNFNFLKPPKNKNIYIKLFEKLKNKEHITNEDLVGFNSSKNKNHLYELAPSKKFDQNKLINQLNILNNEWELAIVIEKYRLREVLLKEYADLLCRWLKNLNIIVNIDKNQKDIDINDVKISLKNNSLFIAPTNIPKDYPFSFEQTKCFLLEIAKKNFKFKNIEENKCLKDIANYTIAEYFVNLYFAYLLKIKVEEFSIYSNTKINSQLLPMSQATGRHSDFVYSFENKLYSVETTIHTQKNQTIDSEATKVIRHLTYAYDDAIQKYKFIDDIKLFFVSYFNDQTPDFSYYFEGIWEKSKIGKIKSPNNNLLLKTFNQIVLEEKTLLNKKN